MAHSFRASGLSIVNILRFLKLPQSVLTASLFFMVFWSLVAFSTAEVTSTYKLIVFEGSDWCRNCIRFNQAILSVEIFQNFTRSNNIQIERIDFPQKKKLDQSTREYNASVAERYQFDGRFPTILLVSLDDDLIRSLGYTDETPEEFISLITFYLLQKQ